MDERLEIRSGLIPYGNCVPDGDDETTSILFTEIDSGRSDERSLALGKKACEGCPQLPFCEEQREELATELWNRGAGFAVIGGSTLEVRQSDRPITEERPAFTFDLTKIPEDAGQALAILRQGFRAEQFKVAGPTPEGVKTVGAKVLEHLKESQPELHTQIMALGDEEVSQCVKYICTALFQQKDFARFSQGKRWVVGKNAVNMRYQPDRFNITTDGPIVIGFLEDAVRLRNLGFKKVASKAAYFEPTYFEALSAGHKDTISWSEFETVIDNNKLNPLRALQKHHISRERVREENPGTPEAYVRTMARVPGTTSALAEGQSAFSTQKIDAPYLTDGLIRSVTIGAKDPEKAVAELVERVETGREKYGDDHPVIRMSEMTRLARTHRTAEGYLKALAQFEGNFNQVKEELGDRPGMSSAYLRRFSDAKSTPDALRAARNYLDYREELIQKSNGSIPVSVINKYAVRGLPFTEVQSTYLRDKLSKRFNQRGGAEIPPAIIERVVSLYPQAEVDASAEAIYKLISDGNLAVRRAETYLLRGQTPEVLDKIFAPKTQEYVTFPAAFNELNALQRLAFAHYHGLMPILYGVQPNSLQFEHSALGGTPLEDYYQTHLEPLLAGIDTTPTGKVFSTSQLTVDIDTYNQYLAKTDRPLVGDGDRLVIQGARDAAIIVGGKALYLHERGYQFDWTDAAPDFSAWLTQKVAATYPPLQQEKAWEYVSDAIQTGSLDLIGSHPGEYQLVLGSQFYGEGISNLDRAAIAHAMGIDRILYGSDLAAVLDYRLGSSGHTVRIERSRQPAIIEYGENDLAEVDQSPEAEPVDISSLPPLEQFIITLFGQSYDIQAIKNTDWKKIGDALLNAYNGYIENPNHQHEVTDATTQAQIALAWTAARGGDIDSIVRMFSMHPHDVDEYVEQGLAYIREQLAIMSDSSLRKTRQLLKPYRVPQDTPRDEPARLIGELGTPVDVYVQPSTAVPSVFQAAPEIEIEASPKPARRRQAKLTPVDTPLDTAPDSTPEPHQPSLEDEESTEAETTDGQVIIVPTVNESAPSVDIVKVYGERASAQPLLRAEQEVELTKSIEAGVLAADALANGGFRDATREELERIIQIGKRANQQMIEANLRLVMKMAVGKRRSVPYLDLVQYGNIGLMHAVQKFDYTKGYKFSTYAINWIRQAIARGVEREAAIRVPDLASQMARSAIAFRERVIYETGAAPTMDAIAQHLNVTPQKAKDLLDLYPKPIASLDRAVTPEGDVTLGDFIEDADTPSPESLVVAKMVNNSTVLQEIMRETMSGAAWKSATVLALRYGLQDDNFITDNLVARRGVIKGRSYTLDEVAEILDISSRETVRSLERKALDMLRHPSIRSRIAAALQA